MSNAQKTTSTEDLSTPTSTPQSFGPPADGGNVVRRGRDGQKQNAGKNEVTSHEVIPLPDAPRGDAQASSSAGTSPPSSSTPKPVLGSGGHSGEVKLSKRQMTDVMFGPPVTGPLVTNRTKTIEWPREDYFGKPIRAKSGRPPHFTIEQWLQLSQQQRHIQTDLYRMELEARAAGVDNTCVVAPSGGNVGVGKVVKPFALQCVRPKLSMVEFCCGENSRLGRREFAKRCRVWRITEKHDARTKAGRKVTLDAVTQAGPGLLWASMPCTGGCRWQIPNYKKGSAETRAKIDQHRRDFQLIWGTFIAAARKMHVQGGRVAIEWPRDCLYWDYPAVKEALQELGLVSYECHGCALGLKAPDGAPVFKPWRIATNDEYVGGALARRKCVGGHVHTPCAGSVTKMTE